MPRHRSAAALTAAAIVLALGAFLFWLAFASPTANDAGRSALSSLANEALAADGLRAHGATPASSAVARSGALEAVPADEASPEVPSAFAALELEVLWESERSPAEAIDFELHCTADGFSAVSRLQHSDAEGRARWSALPPGPCTVRSRLGGWLELVLVAGQTTRARFTLAAGPAIEGRVIDETGLPVADAEIWLGPEGHPMIGAAVARSLSNGSFALRTASVSLCVGARKAGYRPSPLVDIESRANAGVRVELVLTRGGAALMGHVRFAGAPCAGAAIVVGSARHTTLDRDAEGRFRFEASALEVRSAEDGSFAIEGLAPGTHEVRVRAVGCAAWFATEVLTIGERAQLEIELLPEAVLSGRAVNAAGEPLAGARIRSGHEPNRILHRARLFVAQSDAQGFFRIGELPAGERAFEVESHGFAPQRASFHLHSGATTEWHPIFGAGAALRGRVLDEHQAPLAGWQVHVYRAAQGDAGISQSIHTDESGRFAFAGLAAAEHRLQVFDPAARPLHAALVLPNALPTAEEFRLVIAPEARATARVVGRLVDASGAAAAGAEISIETAEKQPIGRAFLNDEGRFELGPLRPGSYRAVAAGPSLPELQFPPLELALHQTLDVGELRFAAAAELLVEIEATDEIDRASARFELWRGDTWIDDLATEERVARHRGLAAGSYELRLGTPGLFAEPLAVELRAGETTRVVRRVEQAAQIRCELRCSSARQFDPPLELRVLDSEGRSAFRTSLQRMPQDGFALTFSLRSGSHRAEIVQGTTRIADADLGIPAALGELRCTLAIPDDIGAAQR